MFGPRADWPLLFLAQRSAAGAQGVPRLPGMMPDSHAWQPLSLFQVKLDDHLEKAVTTFVDTNNVGQDGAERRGVGDGRIDVNTRRRQFSTRYKAHAGAGYVLALAVECLAERLVGHDRSDAELDREIQTCGLPLLRPGLEILPDASSQHVD